MRFFKRKLAIVLALLLVLPIIPARAEETGMMTGALAELDIAHEDTANIRLCARKSARRRHGLTKIRK